MDSYLRNEYVITAYTDVVVIIKLLMGNKAKQNAAIDKQTN